MTTCNVNSFVKLRFHCLLHCYLLSNTCQPFPLVNLFADVHGDVIEAHGLTIPSNHWLHSNQKCFFPKQISIECDLSLLCKPLPENLSLEFDKLRNSQTFVDIIVRLAYHFLLYIIFANSNQCIQSFSG